MKATDFEIQVVPNGKKVYCHIENGKQRKQMLKDVMSGKISQEQFKKEQKKMRGGKYLKYHFSEQEYNSALETICDTAPYPSCNGANGCDTCEHQPEDEN